MYRNVEQRLTRLINAGQEAALKGGGIGVEKESLRVSGDGSIAQTPHPTALGSALTHPYITTDYSEALAEFITPPLPDIPAVLQFLCDTQRFVYSQLEDELLWATSMPCVVRGADSIPIAQYGSSNAGMMKTVYRRGLGHRYGRTMQVIAGVHFNYSLPEALWPVLQELDGDRAPLQRYIDDGYFRLIRNLQRFGWIVPYLFGASPAVCKSFLCGQQTHLDAFDQNTYFERFGTSLRMGDIGYQNNKEEKSGIKANYDGLEAYVDSLTCAINTPCPEYEKMGVVVDGRYEQLNANILQIENEYYSTIRPKQLLEGNEKPTLALKRRGVRYVELRSLDVNAFDPLGIHEDQLYFLEAFLIFCLLHDSPPINAVERRAIDENELLAAHRGREPGLLLHRDGEAVELRVWAQALCDAIEGVCDVLDRGESDGPYSRALARQCAAVADPQLTPSARMLAEMRDNKESFFAFALRMSQKHKRYFDSQRLSRDREQFFVDWARRSLEQQREMEASDRVSFDEYLRQYFAQA